MVNWEVISGKILEMLPAKDSASKSENVETLRLGLAMHVLEYLPEKFDAALNELCQEAILHFMKEAGIVKGYKPPPLARLADAIVSLEAKAIRSRLGIQEGPASLFIHRSHYEKVLTEAITRLLADGEQVTQERVAEKLNETLGDPTIDERMIRRWNREYGVDWKEFKSRLLNRTNSS